ncbi:MAG: hypothetical protein NTZ09_10300 [Candidatus Hydrogenedentes bacterium]|nr:hypothetical protein [Candidatus Hydrogenedentota bacterium]
MALAFSGVAGGAQITVGTGGQYQVIQDAIDASNSGDEIIVSPRIYAENIGFYGKNIILRSTNPDDWDVIASTTIDGSSNGAVVTFSGFETSACMLMGFNIQNGNVSGDGAGIRGNGTHATIRRNVIEMNTARGYDINDLRGGHGGGIFDCDGLVERNFIISNIAVTGGGLYGCDGNIQNNMIGSNEVYCVTDIYGNSVYGSGGGLDYCRGTIQNNTIVYNFAENTGGGLSLCSAIRNCILWGNSPNQLQGTSATFCCVEGGATGAYNFSSDPMIDDAGCLLPNSPCIDAGSATSATNDLDGDPRGFDGTSELRGDGSDYDVGADEYVIYQNLSISVQGSGTTDPPAGDHNCVQGWPVTITANESGGWHFDHWTGDLTGSDNPATVTVDSDMSICAVFVKTTHTLTISVEGNGSTVPPAGANIYDEGAVVTVLAVNGSGSSFKYWQGAVTTIQNPVNITMDANKYLTAVFEGGSNAGGDNATGPSCSGGKGGGITYASCGLLFWAVGRRQRREGEK